MTVNSTARKQDFAGGQGVLTYTFSSTPSHPEYLKVTVKETATEIETELVYNDTYTVVQAGDGVGGTVTVSPSFSTAYTQTVWRDTEKKQESDYDDYNQFPADTLERDLDRLMFLTQEMAEDIGRAIVNPITEDDPLTLEDIQDIADDAEASAVIATSEATTATTQAGIATAQATIATSEATTCIAGVASVNLPIIGAGDATKILRVNSGETAYELAALELATSAEAIAGTEAANLMTPSLTTIAISASTIPISYLSTDGTLASDSDEEVPSVKAVKEYADQAAQVDDVSLLKSSGVLSIKDSGVTQAKLSTSTGSSSGTSEVSEITMNAYSFFPNVYTNTSALATDNQGNLRTVDDNTDSQIGRFAIYVDGKTFDAQWRYVNSSDENHWIYALKQDNKIIQIWEAADHPWVDELHPFGKLKANQEVVLFDDKDIKNIIKEKRKKINRNGRSLASYILETYNEDKEEVFNPRVIVEEDLYDEKEGDIIGIEKDGRKIKKRTLTELPVGIKYKSLKKK